MRPSYAEYVKAAMRKYLRLQRGDTVTLSTQAEIENWNACHHALSFFSPVEQEILSQAYERTDPMPHIVRQIAETRGLNDEAVWGMINRFEDAFAERRGLK